MRLFRLFRGDRSAARAAESLYATIVAQARRPEFYTLLGVPDTVDGRFDMIALHMFLVLQRLKQAGPKAAQVSQSLFDTMFADMDRNLREMGAGDLGVGRRVRAMAEGLYGRIAAYEEGLTGDDVMLAAALRRNVFGTLPDPGPPVRALSALCGYLRTAKSLLAGQEVARVIDGHVTFPEPSFFGAA